MSEILLHYKRPDPTTWVYLSSFLTIGLFFAFHRFWSLRNLDLILLILLAPGLLMVHEGRRRQLTQLELAAATAQVENEALQISGVTGEPPATLGSAEPQSAEQPLSESFSPQAVELSGFIWLLSTQFLILVRLLVDPMMVRRPLLDPNLTVGGMLFIGIWLFIFLMANVITSTPRLQVEQGPQLGPGYSLMNMLPALPTRPVVDVLASPVATEASATESDEPLHYVLLARVLVIAAHLAIVTGIIGIGVRHFGNTLAGVGCAMLYLLVPYTAQMTGRVDHALPAALMIWAIFCYRKPIVAGLFLGVAAGLVYYPLFLLPLWFSFYWLRGAGRFAAGVAISLGIMMALLVVDGSEPLTRHLMRMYGLMMPMREGLRGVWGLGWPPMYRLPILVAFLLLSGFFAAWPSSKNLGTLIACSTALLVACQFWHADGGGLYMAWFLPLLLLTMFRPNLDDRVALKVIDGGQATLTRRSPMAGEAA